MATWVIGDVHGCWRTLQRLLERIHWDAAQDRLWLVGDLVNRGPDSLAVLRWASHHERQVTAVLGNHDLHLLSRAAGLRGPRRGDSLDELLAAADAAHLIDWLAARPLIHHEAPWLLVHAGLLPSWQLTEAIDLARAVGLRLQQAGGLAALAAHSKIRWRDTLAGDRRLAAALNVFTRIRVVTADGRPDFAFTGAPAAAPAGSSPWYAGCRAAASGTHILCGHWATAGLFEEHGVSCLDSGCVWGGSLSARCLETRATVSVAAVGGEPTPQRTTPRS